MPPILVSISILLLLSLLALLPLILELVFHVPQLVPTPAGAFLLTLFLIIQPHVLVSLTLPLFLPPLVLI